MSNKCDLNRLIWRSRRGMLELDILLIPFITNNYLSLSDQEKNSYNRLVDSEDPELYSWFMKMSTPDDIDVSLLVSKILNNAKHVLFHN